MAGRALKQMARDGVEPSPDNYRRYFYRGEAQSKDAQAVAASQCEDHCKSRISGVAAALSRNVDHLLCVTTAIGISLDESGDIIGGSIDLMRQSAAEAGSFEANLAAMMDASRKIGAVIASARHTIERYQSRIAELQTSLEQTTALVRIDHLTGATNRRGLYEIVARECANAARTALPLSFASIDMDNFRAVNNEYGHDAGDAVLQEFAVCVRAALRNTDSFVRLGGEEFLLVFPGAAVEGAMYVVDRIRQRFQQPIHLPSGASVTPTFSAGFADLVQAEDGKSAISRADQALLAAKRQGKNRNVAWSESIRFG